MDDPVISVQGLEKTYPDGTRALRGVTFEVQAGEIFGLLGPNGAGKTTAMRILGTIGHSSAGKASVLGMDVKNHPMQIRRRIGFAMQEVGMDDLATAREMLVLHARLYGIARQKAVRRADELLSMFDLNEHADRRVTRFSGGMQRRLDLAVSLIHEPEVLFLDEPSTGLDPKSRSDLWAILRNLRDEHGLTILMSTHYMEEADVLCDRLAVMSQGAIAATNTPERLKRSVGSDVLRVRLKEAPNGRQADQLESIFGHYAEVHDDMLEIRVKDGGESLLPALSWVSRIGLGVASTRVVSPSLDDAYLHYTGQRLETDAEVTE